LKYPVRHILTRFQVTDTQASTSFENDFSLSTGGAGKRLKREVVDVLWLSQD